MRNHTYCPDCNKPFDCAEVMKLFRGYAIRTPELIACPCCFALYVDGAATADQILYDFCCRDCAGSVGTARLQEMLDTVNGRAVDPATLPAAFRPPYDLWRLAPGDRYYTLDGPARLWGISIFGRETGAAPAPSSIILKPGQKRCGCNNCERLRVQEA